MCATTALAFMGTASFAGAGKVVVPPDQKKPLIFTHGKLISCLTETTHQLGVIGSVEVLADHSNTNIEVNVVVQHAPPKTILKIDILCRGQIGTLTTDSGGGGSATILYPVTGGDAGPVPNRFDISTSFSEGTAIAGIFHGFGGECGPPNVAVIQPCN